MESKQQFRDRLVLEQHATNHVRVPRREHEAVSLETVIEPTFFVLPAWFNGSISFGGPIRAICGAAG